MSRFPQHAKPTLPLSERALRRLARGSITHRKAIVLVAGLFVIVAAFFGGNVASKLSQGGFDAPSDDRGPIALAIWEIMYPSSTTNGPAFDSDPAAQPYELEAEKEVDDGSWTKADSALYPTWVPDDSSLQRFGVILDGVTGVEMDSSAPEPANLGLMFLGVLGLAAFSRRL